MTMNACSATTAERVAPVDDRHDWERDEDQLGQEVDTMMGATWHSPPAAEPPEAGTSERCPAAG